MSTTEKSAEVLATAASIFLSGLISSISLITIPTLLSTSTLTSNDLLLKQWKSIYDKGSKQGPMIAIVAGITHGGIAYSKWTRGESPTIGVLAAVLTVGIAPFTRLVMSSTNTRLMNVREKQEDARELVNRWMWLNGMRGLLPLIGGVLSLFEIAR